MTPDDHFAEADRILRDDPQVEILRAIAHALLATYRPMNPEVRRMQDDLLAKQGQIDALRAVLRDVTANGLGKPVVTITTTVDRPKPGPPPTAVSN